MAACTRFDDGGDDGTGDGDVDGDLASALSQEAFTCEAAASAIADGSGVSVSSYNGPSVPRRSVCPAHATGADSVGSSIEFASGRKHERARANSANPDATHVYYLI